MTSPEQALETARQAAAAMRASGAYQDVDALASLAPADALSFEKLFEWAVIDPDLRNVRSTRLLGAPITAIKRALLWALRQYHGELIAQQTRFNVNAVLYVRKLEDQLAALEERLEELSREQPGAPPRST